MSNLRIAAYRIILIIFLALNAGIAVAQQSPPIVTAEQRVKSLIDTINGNDYAALRKFISENFTKSALQRVSAKKRFTTIARLYDRTRGLSLQSVRQTKPNEVAALVNEKLFGENSELIVQVEENAPYQINAMGYNSVPAKASAKKLSDKQISEELDAFLKKLSAADNFSGAVLLAKGDKVLFKKAYGEANKDFQVPNNVNTKFNLGSMNKMFTAVSIAQLVEAEKLSFEDPLGKFMPDFPNKEAAEKVRVKHLLTHTSGLGMLFNSKFVNSSREKFRTVDDYLELVKDEKLAFEPGTKWSYGNSAFVILGKIIEKVSGQNYFDYVRENIYKKAGMTSSDSYQLDRVNSNLAIGYEKEYTDKGIVFRNNIFQHVISGMPAGGGYSTVEDLMKFAAALQTGKLVSQETVKILLSPKPEINSPDYGYGFFVNNQQGFYGHGGGFEGISSDLTIFPNKNYTAVVLSNYGLASDPVVDKIRELIR